MIPLKIYDSLSREKREFVPFESGKVSMYVCGITVYDYCHMGHARLMVAFDVVQRWLRRQGYDVTYVRNVTDIDDKIIRRALENNETVSACAARFTQYMHEDEAAIGIEQPDQVPLATHFVPQMHDIISRLQEKGLAYQAASGDVNFSVRDFEGYGRLSGKSLDELRAGERVEVNTDKRSPLDFVLWKSAKENEPDDAKWVSPWGVGRPGWHIECSAMACSLLGHRIDIHGGGHDLQFPHHENEIAQTEGAFGAPWVGTWMHNGFVQIDNEKMSKSLGNFFTIRDALKQYDGEVLRFFLLRAQYRTQINYSAVSLDDARQGLARLYTALKDTAPDSQPLDRQEAHALKFAEAMNDDFNTPEAVAVLYALASEVNRTGSAALARQLRLLAQDIGMLGSDPVEYLQRRAGSAAASGADLLTPAAIEVLIAQRVEAKAARDFARSDAIRSSLLEQGIALEDRPGNRTEWRRV